MYDERINEGIKQIIRCKHSATAVTTQMLLFYNAFDRLQICAFSDSLQRPWNPTR